MSVFKNGKRMIDSVVIKDVFEIFGVQDDKVGLFSDGDRTDRVGDAKLIGGVDRRGGEDFSGRHPQFSRGQLHDELEVF